MSEEKPPSWVTIDQEKCTACGVCAARCARCFRQEETGVFAAQAGETNCNRCGHCVALCPAGAITHTRMDMENFPPLERAAAPATDEFVSFLRARRSHRRFKDKPVPRELAERLVDTARYAPTGSNVQSVHLRVLTRPERIKLYSDLTVDFMKNAVAASIARYEKASAAGELTPALENEYAIACRRKGILAAHKLGLDPIFHKAPLVMAFHSPRLTSTPRDNCVIASTLVGLTASTMGLGWTYIGFFVAAAAAHQPLVEALALPEGHQVFSTIILGYPVLKFQRAVDRDPVETIWE